MISGANTGSNTSQYNPQPTSYDYDAPLNEAGDQTQKYFVLLEVISRYMGMPSGILPPPSQKYSYGQINMTKVFTIYNTCAVPSLVPTGAYPEIVQGGVSRCIAACVLA